MAKNKAPKRREPALTPAQSAADYIMKIVLFFYVFVMLVIYPMFYDTAPTGRYFTMGETKYLFFQWFSYFGIAAMVLGGLFYLYAYNDKISFLEVLKNTSLPDRFVVAYFFVSWLSYLFASEKSMAFWGYNNWNMGFITQVFLVLVYFFVSRFWVWSPWTVGLTVLAAAGIFQMVILQRFGFDPMDMYVNVKAESVEKFVGTLGQTTWFSSYAVLVVPIGMYLYWGDDRLWMRICSGIFVALSFGMLTVTNSDSAYVAFVLIFMVFFCYSLKSNEKMYRFLEMAIIGLLSMRVIGWMRLLFPERTPNLISGDEKITEFATKSTPMLILLIIMIIAYAVFRFVLCADRPWEKTKTKKTGGFDIAKYSDTIWRVTLIAAVLVIWGVLMMILLVSNHKLPADWAVNNVNFFNFTNEWGNHRGFNWRMAARAFTHASFKDLILGIGPDCFAVAMNKYCYEDVSTYWRGQQLACAHNEFLNMLITEGVLGVIAYLGIFIAAFRECMKIAWKEPAVVAFMAAIPAYIGHNFFCYQQCICTPEIFIIMGICIMMVRAVKAENAEQGEQSK